ncbi:TetR/AcrR family transcriptional regulator [Pseudonocardia sp. GCM10023141]|uniref:TetR/AcrR family transcriptional regulator n=1 Tax=Pseudonocardia sp. GCM10023141 TaxID=3252653 RepID=UPI0036D2AD94
MQDRLLDAADELFYARGVQGVAMDELRSASGLSLKRVYGLYPSKEQLVKAWLERRDTRWRGRLAASVERVADVAQRPLAVFDWLHEWFSEPGFRGCAWINTFGELGSTSTVVAQQARSHKAAFRAYLGELVAAAGLPDTVADHLLLLAEGAMVTASIFDDPAAAWRARAAAAVLIAAV